MDCSCGNAAVIGVEKPLCKPHFLESFEERVRQTIERYGLLQQGEKVAVACSGGKDSTTVLYLLKKLGWEVTAVAIDEGIEGYRESTLQDLKIFCAQQKVELKVYLYKEAFGLTIDELVRKTGAKSPCRSCGILRRYLTNLGARDFDALATGHNLDDEAQSILMNLLGGNTRILARIGPKTGVAADGKFTRRVKPLYLCHEKEVAAYALLRGFGVRFAECPNALLSYRNQAREVLNRFEMTYPGAKRRLAEFFLARMQALKAKQSDARFRYCSRCREPSDREVCGACRVQEAFAS